MHGAEKQKQQRGSMAIYHLTAKTGSRSGGQSARAKADYIQREGKYARDMDEVLHAESGHMPEFVERPAAQWFKRYNGKTQIGRASCRERV